MVSTIWSLNWADYSIVTVILFSILISLTRGFLRECISLATWVIAFWVSFKYGNLLANFLSGYIVNPSVRLVSSFAILFVITLIIGSIANFFVSLMVMKTGLNGTDRLLGMFFGAIRGLLLVTIILLMISTTSFVKEDWWKSSCLIPYFKDLIGWMHGIIPDKVMHMTTLFKKS